MAFPHHDPRYAQSPYHFQPPFPPPQQHNAFGLGHPVPQTQLAPPQAYLTNRPQPPYPPHPPVPGQAGFPGSFPNAGQFQHNAQYNSNMMGGQAHIQYQPPQQIPPQFYNPQGFRNGPPPPGQMPGMSASSPPNVIPPPPAPLQTPMNSGGAQWPNNPGLPPKPPSVGYREAVELHSRQSSAHMQQGPFSGNGNSSGDYAGGTQQQANTQFSPQQNGPNVGQSQSQASIVPQNSNFDDREVQPNGSQFLQQYNSASNGNNSASAEDQPQSTSRHELQAEASPDMYSPQLHPQHLPGLGDAPGGSRLVQRPAAKVPSISKSTDGQYSPPAVFASTTISKDANAQMQIEPVVPTVDPFAIKERASQALRDLDAEKIGFLDIAGNGIHPNVLRNLYLELGLELDPVRTKAKENEKEKEKAKQKEKEKDKENVKKAATKRDAPKADTAVVAKSTPAPVKKPQAPAKPLSREEYLAKLRAAKGDKASPPTASEEPPTEPKPTQAEPEEIITIGSDSEASQPPKPKEASPKPPPAKKVDLKSKEQNALIRQRLEALKKSTLEKQQREAEEAAKALAIIKPSTPTAAIPKTVEMKKANNGSVDKANGEYTPANPFFASTASFSGLPGLSMFESGGMSLPGFEAFAGEGEQEEDGDDLTEPGEIEKEPAMPEVELPENRPSRKRSYEPETYEESRSDQHQVDSYARTQFIIELSDDEEDGELPSNLEHPDMQRQLSATSATPDQNQLPQLQSRIDALAAHEESIRLYKQKIELLEAKKRAKKAMSSNATPTPSGTPSQIRPLARVPETTQSGGSSSALVAAGEKVQAQQDSFVATKTALVQRLELEEARATADASTPRKNQQQQRIDTLRVSIAKIDSEIAQAETEKQRIQQEIERGIQGREKFSRELSELLAEMEAEDAAARTVAGHQSAEMGATVFNDEKHESDRLEHEIDDAGDVTMEISDDEDGEISDDDAPNQTMEHHTGVQEAVYDEFNPNTHRQAESKASPLQLQAEPDEDEYTPQLAQSTPESDDAEMEYEPDEYEPQNDGREDTEQDDGPQDGSEDFEPAAAEEPLDDDGQDGSAFGEYDSTMQPQAILDVEEEDHDADAAQNNEDAASPLPVVSVSDSSAESVDDGSEEGEMIDDDNDADDSEENSLFNGHLNERPENEVEVETIVNTAEETDPSDDAAEPEEIRMDESSDSEPSNDEVPGGFRSLTSSHRIDPQKQLCHWELQGGVCADSTCNFQHFRDMTLSDDKLILELGSLKEGTSEQQNEYRNGLRALLISLRETGVSGDPEQVARELAAYRLKFWGDPTRIITRNNSGL